MKCLLGVFLLFQGAGAAQGQYNRMYDYTPPSSSSQGSARPDYRLPVDIHIGFENNDVILVDRQSNLMIHTEDSEYSTTPVFKIISPIKLGCMWNEITLDKSKGTMRRGCLGFGLRASGAQKRFKGRWFDLHTDPTAEPEYEYRTDQVAGEVMFGQLSEVSLAFGASVKLGFNSYDLYVFNADQLLFKEVNRKNLFASWAAYLDLQVLLSWPFMGVGNWPLAPFFFMYSYEETMPGKNTYKVPDINTGKTMEMEFRTRTHTVTMEVMF
ncbi:MAG: hypothetical protein OEZ59_05500 [Deltaproteobacteria bacterium]|nr:hypothetical protein [Deltaproteobacteria bacterium]